ncbi:MAG: NUDIX hydrolase [archaeon]|jgi:8-oxo-dGTP diphosphatase
MEKKPRAGASVIVKHEGKILLGKRNKENANGMWVIPGGGIDFGEKIKDAAIREIKEETGIDIHAPEFVCFKELVNLPADYHSIVFFFKAKPKHTNIVVSDDLSEAGFFTIEEIKKMNIVFSVIPALKEAGYLE